MKTTLFNTVGLNLAQEHDDICVDLEVCEEEDTARRVSNGIPFEVQEKLDGIELGLEAIDSLMRIKECFNRSSTRQRSSIKIAQIAFEDIKRNVGIFNGEVIATECFTQDTVSLEGIEDWIKSIWDAIVRTFNAIWETVSRAFGAERAKAKTQNAKQTVSDLKESAKASDNVQVVSPAVTAMEEVIARRFAYLQTELTTDILCSEADKLINSIRGCVVTLDRLYKANMNMDVAVERFNNVGIDQRSISFASEAIVAYYGSIKDNFSKDADLSDHKQELKDKINVDYNSVDRNSIRTLHGLTRGSEIYAFLLKNAVEDNPGYYFLTLSNYQNESYVPVLKYEGITSFVHYGEKVIEVLDEISHLQTEYQNKSAVIIRKQNEILKNMGFALHKVSHSEDASDTRLRLQFYKSVTRELAKATTAMSNFINVLNQSSFDHSDILKQYNTVWQESVNRQ